MKSNFDKLQSEGRPHRSDGDEDDKRECFASNVGIWRVVLTWYMSLLPTVARIVHPRLSGAPYILPQNAWALVEGYTCMDDSQSGTRRKVVRGRLIAFVSCAHVALRTRPISSTQPIRSRRSLGLPFVSLIYATALSAHPSPALFFPTPRLSPTTVSHVAQHYHQGRSSLQCKHESASTSKAAEA